MFESRDPVESNDGEGKIGALRSSRRVIRRHLHIRVNSNKNIKVDVQTGADFVAVTRVVAAKDAVFLGGDGFDTFDNNGVRGGEKLEIKEFDRFI